MQKQSIFYNAINIIKFLLRPRVDPVSISHICNKSTPINFVKVL